MSAKRLTTPIRTTNFKADCLERFELPAIDSSSLRIGKPIESAFYAHQLGGAGLQASHLGLHRSLVLRASPVRRAHGSAGRFGSLFEPFVERGREMTKDIVEVPKRGPADVFNIAHDKRIDILSQPLSEPSLTKGERQEVIDQPFWKGTDRGAPILRDPVRLMGSLNCPGTIWDRVGNLKKLRCGATNDLNQVVRAILIALQGFTHATLRCLRQGSEFGF